MFEGRGLGQNAEDQNGWEEVGDWMEGLAEDVGVLQREGRLERGYGGLVRLYVDYLRIKLGLNSSSGIIPYCLMMARF